jgi:hypothetical protein
MFSFWDLGLTQGLIWGGSCSHVNVKFLDFNLTLIKNLKLANTNLNVCYMGIQIARQELLVTILILVSEFLLNQLIFKIIFKLKTKHIFEKLNPKFCLYVELKLQP